MLKTCSKCEVEKEIEDFYKHPTYRDKRFSYCKECCRKPGSGRRKIGRTNKIEYGIYRSMLQRCYEIKHKSYKNYGARNIKVCDRWLLGFKYFIEDIGKRPYKDYSLERIDVNGDYCPENCRWASKLEQCNNKRCTDISRFKVFIIDDVSGTLEEWATLYNIDVNYVKKRLRIGWNVKRALLQPINRHKN